MHQIPAIINISSQSVYGREILAPSTEETDVAPSSAYSQAKYATELILQSLKSFNHQLHHTSIRLATLAGGAEGLVEVDFLSKIVRQACNGQNLVIQDGSQLMERLDVNDSVSAIISLLKSESLIWKPVYNLSSSEILPLLDIAEMVIEIAQKYTHTTKSVLKIHPDKVDMNFGMDCSLFYQDMNWKPQYTIRDTIESLCRYFSSQDKLR
jgi:nucleoside-diphosphate-sugar epimerase